MADRTWNGIDGRLFDEFGALAAVILAILIARCPNEHGVYALPAAYLERFIAELRRDLTNKSPAELVEHALTAIESAGTIKRYPDRSMWLVNKFDRSPWKGMGKNQAGAAKYIADHHAAVLTDFCSRYGINYSATIVPPQSDSSATTVPQQSDHSGGTVGRTDPDPEPDPEEVKKIPVKSPTSVPPAVDPRLIELAKRIRAKLEQASKTYPALKKLPTFDAEKSALVLGQAIRIDKIPGKQMLELWDWIIADDFWRRNMLSIQNCRKDNGNGPKILQCWRAMSEPAVKPKAQPGRSVDLGQQDHQDRVMIGGVWHYPGSPEYDALNARSEL